MHRGTHEKRFRFRARLQSFRHAAAGVCVVLRTQHNARIHAVCTLAVCVAGAWVHLTRMEWCLVVVAIVAVWSAEAFNTAVEFLTDLVSPEPHALAKVAKDAAAGAVLFTATGALVIGGLVFGPKLLP